MPEKTYTPSDIAGFCDVSPSTVNNWINESRLKAHSTPGGHHRVVQGDLLAFLKQYRMPVPRELEDTRKQVLIVDDEADMVGMLVHAFSLHQDLIGCESSDNGYGALMRIGERKPDLIVLDIWMPEFNGWKVIDHLKASLATRDIKCLVISGHKPAPTPQELAAHKVDAFMEKPFLADDLLTRAANLLGIRLPVTIAR